MAVATLSLATEALQKAEQAVFDERSAKARVIWHTVQALSLATQLAEESGGDPKAARQEVLDILGLAQAGWSS